MKIVNLNEKIVNQIHSQQVIYSLSNIIKELLDNSIDAISNSITLELENYGTTSIKLEDNGIGFKIEDFDKIGKRGVTSKLNDENVLNLDYKYLGFRGEALFGLINQCTVKITTFNWNNEKYCYLYNKDNKKQIFEFEKDTNGTTIEITNIFENNNLRKNNLELEKLKNFKKIIENIKEYSLSYYSVNFKIINYINNKKEIVYEKPAYDSLKLNIIKIFQIKNLVNNKIKEKDFEIEMFTNFTMDYEEFKNIKKDKNKNKCFFYLNKRPIKPIKKITNIFLKSLNIINNNRNNIIWIIFININNDFIDLNLKKNKKKVYISKLESICISFNELLKGLLNTNKSEDTKELQNKNLFFKNNENEEILNKQANNNDDFNNNENNLQKNIDNNLNLNLNNSYKITNFSNENTLKNFSEKLVTNSNEIKNINDNNINLDLENNLGNEKQIPKINMNNQLNLNNFNNLIQNNFKKIDISKKSKKIYKKNDIEFDIFEENNENKDNFNNFDFLKLKIIGQFNKGFITCMYNNEIYIIDQHASDEKIKYEYKLKNIKLEKYKLTEYIPIELDSEDRLIFLNNKNLLEKQGFEFDINEEMNYTHIISLPSYEKYNYTISDFFNILNELSNDEYVLNKDIIIFQKLKRIIATISCRQSIMVGKILDNKEMLKILFNLSELDSPYNCPHGRPTIIKISS